MPMQAVAMKHVVNPKLEIQKAVAPLVEKMTVLGPQVLIAVYIQPERTAGGIILTDQTREENNYQGKIGLVLKVGPVAFHEDDDHKFPIVPKVGDWVMFRVGDTFEFIIGKRKFRLAEDVSIKAILTDPDIVL